MRHSRAAAEIGTLHIDIAARQGRPLKGIGVIDSAPLLPIVSARVVPLPEPVTWRDLNGRIPAGWEEPLIRACRERERRVELALLAGTLGQP